MGNKDNQLIMVVRKDDLFQNNFFEGFRPYSEVDYESRILENYGFMTRKFAENDPTYKQPILYSVIVNTELKKIFAYQRAKKDKNYGEKRLQGKWSIGIGGHIEQRDFRSSNPLEASMLRELDEEVSIERFDMEVFKSQKQFGYIYHDFGVNAVHFGVSYVIETNGEVRPKDKEIEGGSLMTIDELERICSSEEFEVEDWSKTLLTHLKNFYSSFQ